MPVALVVASSWRIGAAVAFILTCTYVVVGHLVFSAMLRRRGLPIYWVYSNVPLYAEYVYFTHQPSLRTRGFEIFAITVIVSLIAALVLAAVLFPEMLTSTTAAD